MGTINTNEICCEICGTQGAWQYFPYHNKWLCQRHFLALPINEGMKAKDVEGLGYTQEDILRDFSGFNVVEQSGELKHGGYLTYPMLQKPKNDPVIEHIFEHFHKEDELIEELVDHGTVPFPEPTEVERSREAHPSGRTISSTTGRRRLQIAADPNAPVETNKRGGGQSHIPVRFDLVDAQALFEVAGVLHEGAEKYGAGNWRLIPVRDHLNHLLTHVYAYLAGDRSDEHLSHAVCRAVFALAVDLDPDKTPEFDEA